MENKDNIALFIDADNAPAVKIDFIMSELAKYGVVNIRKAYGNWKNPHIKLWENILNEYSIQPMQQFDLTKGKNATDIALVIDAMDILYTKKIDIIGLVSSDCDFTPLVTRARADGKFVIGFGEKKTPEAFVNSCSLFLYLDQEQNAGEVDTVKKAVPNLKGDAKLINMLRQGIEANADDDGWANLGPIGQHISNHASFDHRNYGFSKLSDLFKSIDLFQIKKAASNGYIVKLKKVKKAAK